MQTVGYGDKFNIKKRKEINRIKALNSGEFLAPHQTDR